MCSLLQANQGSGKCRAYLFNKTQEVAGDQVLRMEEQDVVDPVMHEGIGLMGNSQLQDFNVSIKKDVILCKSSEPFF